MPVLSLSLSNAQPQTVDRCSISAAGAYQSVLPDNDDAAVATAAAAKDKCFHLEPMERTHSLGDAADCVSCSMNRKQSS